MGGCTVLSVGVDRTCSHRGSRGGVGGVGGGGGGKLPSQCLLVLTDRHRRRGNRGGAG